MKHMSLKEFGRIVAQVMKTLPSAIVEHLDNVVVDVEDEPTLEMLREMDFSEEEIANGESLYGLFIPMPLGQVDHLARVDSRTFSSIDQGRVLPL